MAGYVGRLEQDDTLDPSPYFEGPWRQFARRSLPPGTRETLEADGVEHAVIVIDGTGTYTVGDQRGGVTPGSSLTIGLGAAATLDAGENGLELFITTLDATAV